MPFKTTIANSIISKVLRNTDFTHATSIFVSIHSADPGETGASEITGYTGTRKAVTFSAPASKASANVADVTFLVMPAVTVTYVGLWDADTAGNFLWKGAVSPSKVVGAGETFTILAGDLDVTLT